MRPDVALDVRETSHTSAGMLQYVRALRTHLPRVAPELRIATIGGGDNFDLAEQLGLPLAIARLRPRLVHFPTLYVPRIVPAPYVVTIHDLIDLEYPDYGKRKVGPYWRYLVGPVLRGARAVITDDDATVALLRRYVGVAPERVRVVPLGVDAPAPLPAPVVRARPYLFYAGNHRPHKDLGTLVRAWETLPERYAVDLVMTGPPEPALASARRGQGELVFLGERDAAELWGFHRGAAAYVHAALREGFGLPLLEALRVGTPVIAAEPAVPGVLRAHVERFAAGDVAALRALAERALDRDPALRERAERGREATAGLTWERTARATADVYRELLA
ncbi:MAG TPA: glycosyltransferase family 1 protein [Candidatus Limnocylindria bacterium]|nr:glycosyltransferase family 1 protein [Candidatus Limnocylindria bacterium]